MFKLALKMYLYNALCVKAKAKELMDTLIKCKMIFAIYIVLTKATKHALIGFILFNFSAFIHYFNCLI